MRNYKLINYFELRFNRELLLNYLDEEIVDKYCLI